MRRLGLLLGLLAACDESGLAGSPQITVSPDSASYGGTATIKWYGVVGADYYRLWVDSELVYEGTDTVYHLEGPARTLRTQAIGGSDITEDYEDLTSEPETLELYERDYPGVAAVGFGGDGSATTYDINDTASQKNFSFYLDDFHPETTIVESIRMVSPNVNAFGDPFNEREARFGWWPSGDTAPPPRRMADLYSPVLVPDSVYAVYLNPDGEEWDATQDHFLKIKVLSVDDSTGKVKFVYWFQRVPGLRWVIEAPKEE